MTTHSCREIETLGPDTGHLSDADRLRLEHHLADCASCRDGVAANRLVRELMHEASPHLSQSARERVLSRALAAPMMQRAVSPRHSVSRRVWSGAAAVLVACGVFAFLFWSPSPSGPVTAFSPQSARHEQAAPDTNLRVEIPVEPSPWIEVLAEEKRLFAHATVLLPAGTRVRFDAATNALTLAAGRIEVDVDPQPGSPFFVHTQHFHVQVLGTQFSVTPDAVQVTHGTVRIVSNAGEVLAPSLAAGESFSFGVPKISAASSIPSPRAQATRVQGGAAHTLEKAREALARGDTQAARALLSELPAHGSPRKDRAEAATLTAEIALLERNPRKAMSLYQDLARRFSDLPAGENACFAAAQLAGRTAPEHEAQLLDRYLATYPRGRFVQEAQQRLEKLRR